MLDPETFRKPRRQKPRTRNENGQEIDLETGLTTDGVFGSPTKIIEIPRPGFGNIVTSTEIYGAPVGENWEEVMRKSRYFGRRA